MAGLKMLAIGQKTSLGLSWKSSDSAHIVSGPHGLFREVLMLGVGLQLLLFVVSSFAQQQIPENPSPQTDKQLNVNWLYGSYIPKDVPLESLNGHQRVKLYVRQTYITWGIYVKTTFFALHDQVRDTYPQWGDGVEGF